MTSAAGRVQRNPGVESREDAAELIHVERIAGGGDGVGREDSGRVIFVPRTAPGDVILADVVHAKRQWAKGRVREYVQLGEDRRPAPCPQYDQCGGCHLQHLTPVEQRRAKRGVVQEALRRIGGVEAAVPDLVVAGNEFGYRNRVTFSFGDATGGLRAGFRMLHDATAVTDTSRCLLAELPIQLAWSALRESWKQGICDPPAGPETRLTIRSASDGSVDMLLRGVEPPAAESVGRLFERVPGLVGYHYAPPGGVPACIAGSETLADRWQGIDFDLPADVFLQVNRQVSVAMDAWLDERVGGLSGARILDLYAGVGARAIRWAMGGAEVTACEVSAPAAAASRSAAARVGAQVVVQHARVEDRIEELLPVDVVVVNPPRSGLTRCVAKALVTESAERLAYVSCDPATLARDLGRLSPAWDLVELQPFEAFPQTAHVETVAWLHRR